MNRDRRHLTLHRTNELPFLFLKHFQFGGFAFVSFTDGLDAVVQEKVATRRVLLLLLLLREDPAGRR